MASQGDAIRGTPRGQWCRHHASLGIVEGAGSSQIVGFSMYALSEGARGLTKSQNAAVAVSSSTDHQLPSKTRKHVKQKSQQTSVTVQHYRDVERLIGNGGCY